MKSAVRLLNDLQHQLDEREGMLRNPLHSGGIKYIIQKDIETLNIQITNLKNHTGINSPLEGGKVSVIYQCISCPWTGPAEDREIRDNGLFYTHLCPECGAESFNLVNDNSRHPMFGWRI